MELKVQALLDRIIDEGVAAALNTCDQLNERDRVVLGEQLRHEIWLQLDTDFEFEWSCY